ncbi:MAG: thioredoxin family protein, partial [Kosmotoga sp.]
VEYVKDISEISKYIMATPGLVVDEVVVHEGKPLPTASKIKEILQKAQA